MRCGWLMLFIVLTWPALAQQVVVQKDFIDLRTGPGRGYPIVQVALKNDHLQLLKQRTDWVKVQYKHQQLWLAATELDYLYPVGSAQSLTELWQAEQPLRR